MAGQDGGEWKKDVVIESDVARGTLLSPSPFVRFAQDFVH